MTLNDITYDLYSVKNQEEYFDRIQQFDCTIPGGRGSGLNSALKNALDNDVTTIIFIDKSSIDEKIIGFCSYCCGSVVVAGDVFPAIEIRSFATDNRYQKLYLDSLDKTCSMFIIEYCIAYLKNISYNHIFARYILLYSEKCDGLLTFYRKANFDSFTADCRSLRSRGENNDIYSLLHVIEHDDFIE